MFTRLFDAVFVVLTSATLVLMVLWVVAICTQHV